MGTRTVQTPTEYMTVTEIATTLVMDRRTVLKWITDGKLPAIRPGNDYRIKRSDFEQLLAESQTRRSA